MSCAVHEQKQFVKVKNLADIRYKSGSIFLVTKLSIEFLKIANKNLNLKKIFNSFK